jgi:tetratricopeptide (TPR) repeat protein
VRDELLSYRKASPESLAAAYAYAAIPARLALERRAWAEAAALPPPPPVLAWDRFPWAGATVAFTRALGAARTGDVALAGREVQELHSLKDALVAAGNKYWADQVEVQRQAASAALARAEGRDEEALRLMRSAADLEGSMDKHPVTPSPVAPARELLGELLLELGRPGDALAEFERSLGTDPNRFRSLYGAARAAERMGDPAKAHGYYERVVALCGQADTERPEFRANA